MRADGRSGCHPLVAVISCCGCGGGTGVARRRQQLWLRLTQYCLPLRAGPFKALRVVRHPALFKPPDDARPGLLEEPNQVKERVLATKILPCLFGIPEPNVLARTVNRHDPQFRAVSCFATFLTNMDLARHVPASEMKTWPFVFFSCLTYLSSVLADCVMGIRNVRWCIT